MAENAKRPAATIRFRGDVQVRPFRRGTYLGREHIDVLIERALGDHYHFGSGWTGFGVVSVALYDEDPANGDGSSEAQPVCRSVDR